MHFKHFSLGLLIILVTGCNKGQKESPSTAKFTTFSYNYFLDQDIIFNNLSENATTYKWDFGDGQTSTDAKPMHSYKVGGIYKVRLTTNNFNTYTKNIRIFTGYACNVFKNNTSYPFKNLKVYTVSIDNVSTLVASYDKLEGGALTDSFFVSSPKMQVLYNYVNSGYSSVTFTDNKNTFYTWDIY